MKQSINVNGAPAAVGPYVHAVKTGNMIFISGQLVNRRWYLPEGIEAQTVQSLENLKTILEGTGSDFDHVVKTTIFLADIADFGKVNEIYEIFCKRSTGPLLRRGCKPSESRSGRD